MNFRLFFAILSICSIFVACSDTPTGPGGSDVTIGTDTVGSDTTACTPQCVGKVCGDDGCGGTCGTCVGGTTCDEAGQCAAACVADCDGKACGGDGCGGQCGQCAQGETCNNGVCEGGPAGCGDISYEGCCEGTVLKYCDAGELKQGDCDEAGNTCGWNPEGGFYDCGFDGGDPSGQFPLACGEECVPDCFGKFCGPDGCGGSCGECGEGQACTEAGVCEACTADCAGKTCGDDGCGGSCGECDLGSNCEEGLCVDPNEACGDITYEGCCDNGVLKYCDNGPKEVDCAGNDSTCGWNAEDNYYSCGKEGADPSGMYPLECGECVADCSGKFCGNDGCGGSCGECADGETCNADFQCEGGACVPDCDGKECGSDGCGGECGEDCGFGFWCDAFGQCNECVPQCDGKSCGPDSCGGSCGTCDDGFSCDATGQCIEGACVADCEGKTCGSDGCGGTCGECDEGLTCSEGACVASASCEGLCGSFKPGNNCQCDDFCFFIGDCCEDVCTVCADIYTDECCEPSCEGKQCGDDGCGGTCGDPCAEGSYCNDEFQCVEEVCETQCEGKQCGDDGCGGTCGECGENQGCDEAGQCIDSAPTLTGTWISTYTFEIEQAPYLNCQRSLNLSSVGASPDLCEDCDYAWDVLLVPNDNDCGDWFGDAEESTLQLGLNLADDQLYVYNEESASWQLFAGEGTVIGNMYTGSYSTGPAYYIDMNESGDYDEGEALDIGTQIGLTWSN